MRAAIISRGFRRCHSSAQDQIVKNVKEQLVNIQKTIPGAPMDAYVELQKKSDVIQNFAANDEGNMEALIDRFRKQYAWKCS